MRHHVSSNNRTLLTLVRLIGRGRVSGRVSEATRYAGNDYRIMHNDSVLTLLTHVFGFLSVHLSVHVSATCGVKALLCCT